VEIIVTSTSLHLKVWGLLRRIIFFLESELIGSNLKKSQDISSQPDECNLYQDRSFKR
jgi:hypothetical protein